MFTRVFATTLKIRTMTCFIINIIILLTKRGTYRIHSVIPENFHEYPSIKILKRVNVLAKVNKPYYVRLLNMTPHDAYISTINVHIITMSEISHEQKE